MTKIFVVEDDVKIKTEMCKLLKRYNYQCEVSDDYTNIVGIILDADAQLVLLDINLPQYDGYYICREIRKISNNPIVIVTSRDSEIDELMGMNLGADDFVTKPYNAQILLARIELVLRRTQRLCGY